MGIVRFIMVLIKVSFEVLLDFLYLDSRHPLLHFYIWYVNRCLKSVGSRCKDQLSVFITTDLLADQIWKEYRTWEKAARVKTLIEQDSMVSSISFNLYLWPLLLGIASFCCFLTWISNSWFQFLISCRRWVQLSLSSDRLTFIPHKWYRGWGGAMCLWPTL